MQTRMVAVMLGVVVLFAGATAHAEFRVADLIYVPVVAHTNGSNGSVWRSDVMISNVESEDAIDVAMIFLPSGLRDNGYLFYDRTYWVGGREADGFGILDEQLAEIPPGGSIVLEDIVETYWPDHSGLNGQGALVVFSYLADSLEDDGSREYRNMTVSSRTYNIGSFWEPDPDNDGEFIESSGTFGQVLNGVPWYALADAGFVSDSGDFSHLLLDGAREDEDFRFNLGFVNTSDIQTTLNVTIVPIQPDGEVFTDADGNPMSFTISLPPMAHVQYFQVLNSVFGLDDASQVRLDIKIASYSTSGVDPHPTFTAYGSLVDNGSNDPTTYAPTFEMPYDIDCMWQTDVDDPKAQDAPRRPVDIPGLW